MTFADLGALGTLADQIILVGDPGQIAPVVTGETRRWAHHPAGPHVPAPDALIAAYPDTVTRLRLPQTWRLGPDTTALIQPTFYPDMPFTSARPPRHVTLAGTTLPELTASPVNATAGPADPTIAATAAAHVRALLDDGQVVDEHGTPRPLTVADVAVITPHVNQAAMIAAHLADLPGLLIATTNQAQGLERDAVIVVHPLTGYRQAPAFATDPGRLCVALTRHRAHAHVLYDPTTPALLAQEALTHPDDHAITAQATVLATLTTGR